MINRYQWHDIFRASLAFLIVLQHIRWLTGGGEFWWGRMQLVVNCFIVLAGFWAAMSLQKCPAYWQWIRKRMWRLWPTYAICLVLALAVRPFVLGNIADVPREIFEQTHFWPLLLAQFSMISGLIPESLLPYASRAFLPSAWFVSLIAQCYLAAPWLCRLSQAWLWRVFALSLGVLLHRFNWRLYEAWPLGSFLPQKLYLFTGGILLYRYAPRLGAGIAPGFLAPLKWIGQESYVIYLAHYPILQMFLR
jgi:peptidoglycan/LPS O-acetylase OafA/YrhL